MNIFVITLKNKEEYLQSPNYKSLKQLNYKIILSKGVILTEKQSNIYFIYAQSSIGIRLAHIKIWKLINKKYKNNYSLILEDDTILNTNTFNEEIKNICKQDFDIYKLHSDFDNGCISLAAYIVNNNSINKLLKNLILFFGHLDADLYLSYLFNKINIKTHHFNIFITDETSSLNRIDNKHILIDFFCDFKLTKRCDKKLKDILSYKVFRIFTYNISLYDILLFIIILILYLITQKKIFLVIGILFYII